MHEYYFESKRNGEFYGLCENGKFWRYFIQNISSLIENKHENEIIAIWFKYFMYVKIDLKKLVWKLKFAKQNLLLKIRRNKNLHWKSNKNTNKLTLKLTFIKFLFKSYK